MTGRLPLTVSVQDQSDGLLAGGQVMTPGLRLGRILALAHLALEHLGASRRLTVLDLLIRSQTMGTLVHASIIPCRCS